MIIINVAYLSFTLWVVGDILAYLHRPEQRHYIIDTLVGFSFVSIVYVVINILLSL